MRQTLCAIWNYLCNLKSVKKKKKKKKRLIALKNFRNLEKKLLIFLKTMLKFYLMLIAIQNIVKLREKDLKY